MKTLKLTLSLLTLALAAAACGPNDGIPSAQAQPQVTNTVTWPEPVEGADSGPVYEYN
jgi:hypothetical protein